MTAAGAKSPSTWPSTSGPRWRPILGSCSPASRSASRRAWSWCGAACPTEGMNDRRWPRCVRDRTTRAGRSVNEVEVTPNVGAPRRRGPGLMGVDAGRRCRRRPRRRRPRVRWPACATASPRSPTTPTCCCSPATSPAAATRRGGGRGRRGAAARACRRSPSSATTTCTPTAATRWRPCWSDAGVKVLDGRGHDGGRRRSPGRRRRGQRVRRRASPAPCVSVFGEPETKAFARHAATVADRLGAALATIGAADLRLVLLHYSPVRDTLQGEPLEIYPFLGSYLLAEAIDATGCRPRRPRPRPPGQRAGHDARAACASATSRNR